MRLIAIAPFIIGILNAQPRPQFEVASVKANPGCKDERAVRNFSPSPGRLEMPCVTLQSLIRTAYGTFGDGVTIEPEPLHMEGGPSWTGSEQYSVLAKAEEPARTQMLAGPMLQALLEERFQLRTHREMRDIPVYTMTAGKSGIKIPVLAEGACTPVDLDHPPPLLKPGDPPPNVCGVMLMRPAGKGEMGVDVRGSTMTQFAQRLSQFADRTVVDKSGIAGRFNFHLEFVPEGRGGDLTAPSDPGISLFTALEEQIGLKLSSGKAPASFLIVDHAEKPAAN